mgnify:CR=1 FL=1
MIIKNLVLRVEVDVVGSEPRLSIEANGFVDTYEALALINKASEILIVQERQRQNQAAAEMQARAMGISPRMN